MVKSSIASKYTHLLLSLPSPDESMIKTIENLINKFVWNNKPGKFQKSIMESDINPLALRAAKTGLTILFIFFSKKRFYQKIFEGEMFIRILPTTLLQIFCENLLYFQVIFKSMKIADNIFLWNSECEWVKYGGMSLHNVSDLSLCLTFFWLSRLQESNSKWTHLPRILEVDQTLQFGKDFCERLLLLVTFGRTLLFLLNTYLKREVSQAFQVYLECHRGNGIYSRCIQCIESSITGYSHKINYSK